jgi:hypothetical protein
MRNQYELAQIFEIGRAQDFVLGSKIISPLEYDVRTTQLDSYVIDDWTDDE